MPFWLEYLLPQVMEMRWILYVSAAELSAYRRNDDDLRKLKSCIENLKSGSCNCDTEEGKQESSHWR